MDLLPVKPKQPGDPVGRPCKLDLDPTIADKIASHVANGSFWEPACKAVGVHPATVSLWLARGQDDLRLGHDTAFSRLHTRLTRAQAEHEAKLASDISNEVDWRAKAFVLERRYRDRWGKDKAEVLPVITINVSGEVAGALVEALRVAHAKPLDVIDTATEDPDDG